MKRSTGTVVPLGTDNSNVKESIPFKERNERQSQSNRPADKASISPKTTNNSLAKTEPKENSSEDNADNDEDLFSELDLNMKLNLFRQLCKAIFPKDAQSALKELKGITLGDFHFAKKRNGTFRATVTVNNDEYEGQGRSKLSAKNMACEKALQDYMISKIEMMESRTKDGHDDEYDLSMLTLAAFASHKLVNAWKTSQLPAGWETMHPCHLLNIMRPKHSYVYFEKSGSSPDRMAVIVGNRSFECEGKSKKSAKRSVAGYACNALFGTEFCQ